MPRKHPRKPASGPQPKPEPEYQPLPTPDAARPGRHQQGMGYAAGADQVARSRSVHDWLREIGKINRNAWEAAERYRDDYEMAHGASGGGTGGSVAPWERTPGQAQINAITRLRRANEVLDVDLEVVVAGVVHGQSLGTLLLRFGGVDGGEGSPGSRARTRVVRRLIEAALRLEGHYFGVRKRAGEMVG